MTCQLLAGLLVCFLGFQEPPSAQESKDTETAARRLPPRPEQSDEERAERIRTLRVAYDGKSPDQWPKPTVDAGVTWKELGLPVIVADPKGNPSTPEKIELGKSLFFDPRLSGTGQMACASCHDPELGWTDGRSTSFGHSREVLKRNAPGIMNVASNQSLFWDGRADSLEKQALAVLANPSEMRSSSSTIETRLKSNFEYRKAFEAAFPGKPIEIDRVAEAIATFERSVKPGRSRFDAYLKGNTKAMSDAAISGLDLFRKEARCMNCHFGPDFSDFQFHNLGLSYYGRTLEDLGRYRVTGKAEDVGRFKTPSLRNIGNTAPYMHNGLFELDGVLNMYNAGMATLKPKPEQENDPLFPVKSPHLKSLGLNKRDLADLKEFLLTLTEPKLRVRPPALSTPGRINQ
jgi:cytochrome c peroxidase